MKNKGNLIIILLVTILASIGILFLIGGIFAYKTSIDFEREALKAEATIEDITTSYSYDSDGDKKTNHDVLVQFVVDGQIYEGALGSYNSSMHIGDKITIYYDPEDPNDFRPENESVIGVIFSIVGAAFLGIAIVILLVSIIKKNKQKKKKAYLMENGILVSAHIDTVGFNANYSINGRNPYVLECSYLDPNTNKLYLFKSGNLWFEVETIISRMGITEIDVYIDRTNPEKYYMDVEKLKKYIGN